MTTLTIEQNDHLEKLLTSNPNMEKKVRNIMRTIILEARASVVNGAQSEVNSTKAAYMAVRSAVYKRVIGGNINILTGRKAGGRAQLPPVRHRLETETNSKGNHRGGNRMPRSRRTEDLLTYYGRDRGFILRFLNNGTQGRDTNGVRRVGQIAGRNWFGPRSQQAFNQASEKLAQRIDELILQEFNEA